MKKVFLSLLILFSVVTLPIFAEFNRMGVPDSSAIREKIAEAWFYPSYKNLKDKKPEVYSNSIGQKFQVRVESNSEKTFSVIVAPEVSLSYKVVRNGVETTETVSEFIADARGSWILERNIITGKPVCVRYYFVQDGDVFVQFSQDSLIGNKTLVDYIIGGCYAVRSVPCGIAYDRLFTASFADVLAITERTLPWRYADIHPGQYVNKISMMKKIRKSLSKIEYADYGCYDEAGEPINIFDGSKRTVVNPEKISLDSNGFIKYIIDGLVANYSGSGTLITPLLRKTVEMNPLGYSGVRGQKEDMFFSLDWTRNLAAARLSIQTKKKYLYEKSGVDVKIEPFSGEVTANGVVNTTGYMKNSGYNVKYIPQILYVLGVTEPTYFYLASIRKNIPSVHGKSAEIYKFEDSAVIFPYFDDDGRFACSVFAVDENGAKEMTLGAFVAENKDCYIHLTRVLSAENFVLQ